MDNYIAILYTTLIICAATTNCSGQNWSTENLENQFSSANETHSRHNYDSRTNRSRVSKQLKVVDSTSQANDAVDLVRLLDLWDPSLLIEVWKREPRNVRVSQKCDEDISRFLTGLESSSTWAFKNRWSACGRNFEEWFHPLTPFFCRYKKNMFNSLQCSTTYMSFNEIESGYFNDVSRQRVWDASGRHTWGLFSGGEFWLGASDQCREMDDNIVELMNISNHSKSDENPEVPPYRVSVNSVKLHLEILPSRMNSSHDITIGLCLPSNCRPGDVAELIGYTSNKIFSDSSRRVMIRHVRNLSEGYNFSEDPIFYVMLISFGLASFLVVLGTLYDVALRYRVLNQEDTTRKKEIVDGEGAEEEEHDGAMKVMGSKRDFDEQITISRLWSIKQHNGSLDVWNAKDVPRPLSEALLSFSMLLNISKMASLDVGDDTLAPIHGLRFISIFWIILVHTCLMTNEVSDNKMFRSKAEEDFLYQTISNGTYAVDTFFFISGCLVSFLYFRAMSKQRIKELKITQGFTGKIMQFVGMMSYRYFRLTPPYLLVIGLVQISTKWYHDHSVIELTTLDHQTCERFWWRNALYINTYFDMDDRCMVWSWYLANDTQFYTIGIIILIIAASVVSVGVLIGAVILIASWITTTAIALSNNHAATCFLVCPCGLSRSQLVKACKEPFAHYESLYDKPWTRIGPYLIGMAAGWYLCRIECKLKLSKTLTLLGWTLSIVTLLSIVYGLYGNHFHPISSALYTALSHSAWALSVGFVLIACVTGNGGGVEKILSWKYVYPLSRLTYCVYLIHPVLLRVIILHGESSIHLTRGFMAIMFFGIAVASYVVSLFLSLLFEAPMVSLLRIVHPLRQWKQNLTS